jgi:disulfide bond formation protein DsbB
LAVPVAILTILLIAVSGVIGAYQAGVEWQILPGPSACTGTRIVVTGTLDLNHAVVRCDVAALRIFGISLAGYNALVSLATAAIGCVLLARRRA